MKNFVLSALVVPLGRGIPNADIFLRLQAEQQVGQEAININRERFNSAVTLSRHMV
ncbi:hypothetical protein [Desulfocastanea catecholica]